MNFRRSDNSRRDVLDRHDTSGHFLLTLRLGSLITLTPTDCLRSLNRLALIVVADENLNLPIPRARCFLAMPHRTA